VGEATIDALAEQVLQSVVHHFSFMMTQEASNWLELMSSSETTNKRQATKPDFLDHQQKAVEILESTIGSCLSSFAFYHSLLLCPIDIEPSNGDLWNQLGIAYIHPSAQQLTQENHAKSISAFNNALTLDPISPIALANLGRSLLELWSKYNKGTNINASFNSNGFKDLNTLEPTASFEILLSSRVALLWCICAHRMSPDSLDERPPQNALNLLGSKRLATSDNPNKFADVARMTFKNHFQVSDYTFYETLLVKLTKWWEGSILDLYLTMSVLYLSWGPDLYSYAQTILPSLFAILAQRPFDTITAAASNSNIPLGSVSASSPLQSPRSGIEGGYLPFASGSVLVQAQILRVLAKIYTYTNKDLTTNETLLYCPDYFKCIADILTRSNSHRLIIRLVFPLLPHLVRSSSTSSFVTFFNKNELASMWARTVRLLEHSSLDLVMAVVTFLKKMIASKQVAYDLLNTFVSEKGFSALHRLVLNYEEITKSSSSSSASSSSSSTPTSPLSSATISSLPSQSSVFLFQNVLQLLLTMINAYGSECLIDPIRASNLHSSLQTAFRQIQQQKQQSSNSSINSSTLELLGSLLEHLNVT